MKNILEQSRERINEIDNDLVRLFLERMECVGNVAKYKKEKNLPVLNTARERDIISKLTLNTDETMSQYIKMLYLSIFDISRSYQENAIICENELQKLIENAISNTQSLFPKKAIVACQGVEGSNSSTACDKVFSFPSIMYMKNFDAVFRSVDSGLCKYGILPIENSLHGSVTQVYDLMKEYNFQIVRSVKVKIDHCLLAKPGTKLADIKEVYSHPQALAQCSIFLDNNKDISVKEWENTASSAEMVANSEREAIAAIADKNCADLYNLEIVESNLQNRENNYTRFICISKTPEIYPGADKISIMFTLPHRPGSLYNIISKFSAMGVNLSKLESRPNPERDFEFVFYADMDANIIDPSIQKLLIQLEQSSETFSYLGSYHEI